MTTDKGVYFPPLKKTEGIYFIIESIGATRLSMPGVGVFGPGSKRIDRQVRELRAEHATTFEGKRLGRSAGIKEVFLELFKEGKQIGGEPTGKREWVLAYHGETGVLTAPVINTDLVAVKNGVTQYGEDPIPHVRLYGSKGVKFVAGNGGKGDPQACAFYDAGSRKLKIVDVGRKAALLDRCKQLGTFL